MQVMNYYFLGVGNQELCKFSDVVQCLLLWIWYQFNAYSSNIMQAKSSTKLYMLPPLLFYFKAIAKQQKQKHPANHEFPTQIIVFRAGLFC